MFSSEQNDKNLSLKAEVMLRTAQVRITKQRCAVLETILDSCDHPTAGQIFERAKLRTSSLSLATVYNCLESMTSAHIINQLRFDNGPSRYCSNEVPHAHVIDGEGKKVLDVFLKNGASLEDVFELPKNLCINAVDIYLRGQMPHTV
ncbi:MAG: transcriptional repressor [Akkermansia sp.]